MRVNFQALALAAYDTSSYKEAFKVLGTGNVELDMHVLERMV